MFAVIRTGGKQYRVSENTRIEVERLAGNPGDTIRLDDVLMVGGSAGESPRAGKTAVGAASVFAELLAQTRGDKVLVFKKKRRKNYRRTRGHRQDLTLLRIIGISPSGDMPGATAEESASAGEPRQAAPAGEESETNAPEGEEGGTDAPVEGEAKE